MVATIVPRGKKRHTLLIFHVMKVAAARKSFGGTRGVPDFSAPELQPPAKKQGSHARLPSASCQHPAGELCQKELQIRVDYGPHGRSWVDSLEEGNNLALLESDGTRPGLSRPARFQSVRFPTAVFGGPVYHRTKKAMPTAAQIPMPVRHTTIRFETSSREGGRSCGSHA